MTAQTQELKEVEVERVPFSEVFYILENGQTITPLKIVDVNGTVFGPGVQLEKGYKVAGVDFFNYNNYDLAVKKNGVVYKIVGFYEKEIPNL